MIYIILLFILFIFELLYFKVADYLNIVDKPNERSSHTQVTLRGGGIIFYIGTSLYFIWSGFLYPWFFLGLSLMALISFLDDVFTLSNRFRILIHFSSVFLMAYELAVFSMPWYYLLFTFVVVVGAINAFNFMDGINGITASYSISVTLLLILVNDDVKFIDQNYLYFSLTSILVFAFFNFRTKAKTFAGDVGSVTIAFVLLFALGALVLKSGNIIYILFLVVYGVDSILTIIRRITLRENIFEAHRSHLYQYFANEAGMNRLLISVLYGLTQLIVGLLVIWVSNYNPKVQLLFAVSLLLILSVTYCLMKSKVINKYKIK